MPRRAEHNRSPSRPSITSVAVRAGVSIATVSRVMNGVANKASAETTERVRRTIAEFGYRPTSAGRDLRQRRSRLVALLAANLTNPAMAAIAAAAENALRQEGLVMVLCDTHDRPELQDEYLQEMHAHMARAIVLLGAVASPVLARMRSANEALLFVTRRCPNDPDAPFIGIDNRRAGADIADHFADRGFRHAAVIHGPIFSSATAERLAGFRERACERDLAVPDTAVLTATGVDHLEIGYRAMETLLHRRKRPRAVFCASDLIAFGAHRKAMEAGIAVPQATMIFGFDDSPLNDWVAPWLSSVRVPYDRYGPAIVAATKVLLTGETAICTVLPHRLVVRQGGA
jgi:LacI family transcriptional regulator